MKEQAYKLLYFASDETFNKIKYLYKMKKRLSLNNPKTFNEKLQWLKLYDRNPEYTTIVDKYNVRDYISEKIGNEYLIPLLGVWDNPDDIDFDSLPESFVLKCNHNSGKGLIICKDKSNLNINKTKKELRNALKEDYYTRSRERPYKNVPRKIICEEYLGDNPNDYKFFCFNGRVEYILVCSDRFDGLKETFFNKDKKPNLRLAIEANKILSKNFTEVE